jgi:hypothetical protein
MRSDCVLSVAVMTRFGSVGPKAWTESTVTFLQLLCCRKYLAAAGGNDQSVTHQTVSHDLDSLDRELLDTPDFIARMVFLLGHESPVNA